MTAQAFTHCGEDHGRVVTRLDGVDEHLQRHDESFKSLREWMAKLAETLASHCGARELHVTQPQLEEIKKSVTRIEDAVSRIEIDRKVEAAGLTKQDKFLMALFTCIGTAGGIAAALVINHVASK